MMTNPKTEADSGPLSDALPKTIETPDETPIGQEVEPLPRYRHVKRGSLYDIVGFAKLQSSHPVSEGGEFLVVYRDVETSSMYVRPASEFRDGRFIRAEDQTLETMDEIAQELADEGVKVDPDKWLAEATDRGVTIGVDHGVPGGDGTAVVVSQVGPDGTRKVWSAKYDRAPSEHDLEWTAAFTRAIEAVTDIKVKAPTSPGWILFCLSVIKLRETAKARENECNTIHDLITRTLGGERITLLVGNPHLTIVETVASSGRREKETRNELELLRRWAGGLGLRVPTREDLLGVFGDQDPQAVADHLAKTERPDGPKPSEDLIRLQVAANRIDKVARLIDFAAEAQRRADIPGQFDAEALLSRVKQLAGQSQAALYGAINTLNEIPVRSPSPDDSVVEGPSIETLLAEVNLDVDELVLSFDLVKGILGRDYDGGIEADVEIIETLLRCGKAPRWISSSDTMFDKLGWHAKPSKE